MRQPLAHMFPSLLRSYGSRQTPRYYEDRNSEPYVLQDFSGRQKGGAASTWHSVSASGPDRFRISAPRGSDEFMMIDGKDLSERGNMYGGSDIEPNGIRRDVRYEIQRKPFR